MSLLPLGAVALAALGLTVPEVDPDAASQGTPGGPHEASQSREEFFAQSSYDDTPEAAMERADPVREPAPVPTVQTEIAVEEEEIPDEVDEEDDDEEETGSAGGATVDEVVRLTNSERAAAGCDALRVDDRLTQAAQDHSEDMARREYMDHETPEGLDPSDRAEAAGYDALSGENVAAGQRSAQEVVDAWMNSEGHRRNIVDCDNVAIGVGERDFYWTQKFGAE
ncbi:CAP domain-containing protein [Spiractinospora alimapuensis]|uniref:CAP domain-containing protein n=1 Tax=Spiractinospora alimapuensis TaxID=2820884 RepID=UPI001F15BF0F|nr:CAP domain-containing protein [Spiractinospora alimapuensis]